MPELPPTNSESTNSSNSVSFSANVPLVHSISSIALEKLGFIKFGTEKKNNSIITTYKRGKEEITYDGVHFIFNGKQVQWVEEITENKL